MLKRLHISNFALIQGMDVEFPGGLTVITGETGAGKSIFLEALALVLGKRADQSSLSNKNKKCIIEAEFDVSRLSLQDFFDDEQMVGESTLILRREISADGRSRTFMNDGLVSLSTLKALSARLVDIHSQHQTLLLNEQGFQMELLDAFAGSASLYNEYRLAYKNLVTKKKELEDLRAQDAQAKKDSDYFSFLFEELQGMDFEEGLLKKLEDESLLLENHETIKNGLLNISALLKDGDNNVLTAVGQAKNSLAGLGKFGQAYAELSSRLNSQYLELKELANDIESAGEDLQLDRERLNIVNEKLDKLNRLLKKHQARDEQDLLKIRNELGQKLDQYNSIEEQLKSLEKEITALGKQCNELANKLSLKRKACLSGFEKTVLSLLAELSLENAQFKVELNRLNELRPQGVDELRFLFSANKGMSLNELSKVASGGELSRLMLSLKSILATKKNLPTIIFDEIDTGVSGEVADRIGRILRQMGEQMQVITITHLPQMASKGSHHLFVYKDDQDEQTVSQIRELNKEERITEIAKMLSTGNPGPSALKNAKELLNMN